LAAIVIPACLGAFITIFGIVCLCICFRRRWARRSNVLPSQPLETDEVRLADSQVADTEMQAPKRRQRNADHETYTKVETFHRERLLRCDSPDIETVGPTATLHDCGPDDLAQYWSTAFKSPLGPIALSGHPAPPDDIAAWHSFDTSGVPHLHQLRVGERVGSDQNCSAFVEWRT